MAVLFIGSTASKAHDFEVGRIYYNITSETTVEVTYRGGTSYEYEKEYSLSVVIPETVTYGGKIYSVTSIGYSAFDGCSSLTSVVIPNSVTSIGGSAFYGTGWWNRQPDGLVYLDNWLLDYKDIKPSGHIGIEEGTKGIAAGVFSGCSSMTSVTIPNSVTFIGALAFLWL